MNRFLKGAAALALATGFGIGFAMAGSDAKQANKANPSAGAANQSGGQMQVTEREAVQLFETIDKNSDDKVTEAEWTEWQQPSAGTSSQSQSGAATNESAMMAFKSLDLDQSGALEKQEFVQAALALHNQGAPGTGSTTN